MLVFSKTNCSKLQKQKSSVFPPFWTLSNTFQTPVKRCPQKLNTKTKSPGKQRTSSFSERFFWHFNFRSLFRFYLIPPKTSRIFATFYPFQSNSTLFHPFQPFYVSLVNSQQICTWQVWFFLLFKTITFINCKNNCLFYINKNLIFKLLISTFYTYLRNIGLLRKTIRYLHFHFECASLQRV